MHFYIVFSFSLNWRTRYTSRIPEEWRRIEAVRCGAPLMLRTHQEQAPLPNDTCPMMLTPQKEWAVVVALVGLGGPPHTRMPIFPLPYQDLANPVRNLITAVRSRNSQS
ncbi:hypothetical protein NC652_007762 [Populus alba x Populus x berolinensis]|nr:hypothetical protein NC652_007762 [Populus alba x Populus x berolinensis]